MAQQVKMGAMMACSFGATPASLIVLPVNRTNAERTPAANIMDFKPIVNIPPFGMCSSLANPTVAAATTAAARGADAHAVRAGDDALDSRVANRHDRRHAGFEQHEQMHV